MSNRTARATAGLALMVSMAILQGLPVAAQVPITAESRDNIIIVLDASGSMKQTMRSTNLTRMEAAKQALLAVL
jgi:hypothetical protein